MAQPVVPCFVERGRGGESGRIRAGGGQRGGTGEDGEVCGSHARKGGGERMKHRLSFLTMTFSFLFKQTIKNKNQRILIIHYSDWN